MVHSCVFHCCSDATRKNISKAKAGEIRLYVYHCVWDEPEYRSLSSGTQGEKKQYDPNLSIPVYWPCTVSRPLHTFVIDSVIRRDISLLLIVELSTPDGSIVNQCSLHPLILIETVLNLT